MTLTQGDVHSALWMKLSEHYESRLQELRAMNDADRNDVDTARLRGRIAEIRDFLALANSQPQTTG